MKDDISLQDIQDKLKDACRETKECIKAKEIYDSCATRVNSRSKTEETCHEEMMDYMHCVDHCVSTMWSRNCSPFWST
jgi:ubiquinol-cytochrome c reductase subunit 6